MFTGLIEDLGVVKRVERRSGGASLGIQTALSPLQIGESIAVNGVCLTVTQTSPGLFEVDLSSETLRRTNLALLRPGSLVHLERALSLGGRLGGHLVQGHVDGLAILVRIFPDGDAYQLIFRAPDELMRYIVPQGSVAIDGVSLTVAVCTPPTFGVVVVPHTQRRTHLVHHSPGYQANLEVDLIGKYVEHLLRRSRSNSIVEMLRVPVRSQGGER